MERFYPCDLLSGMEALLELFLQQKPHLIQRKMLCFVMSPLISQQQYKSSLPFLNRYRGLQVSGLSRNLPLFRVLNMSLHSRAIRSFVGNSFHPKLISLAIGTPDHVRAWIQGKLNVSLGWLPRMTLDKVISPFDKPLKTTSRCRAETPKLQLCQNLTDTSTIGT